MIVVDTNIVCYLILERDKTDLARSVYRKDSQWALPPLWRHEFLNVLVNYVQIGGVALADMRTAWWRGLDFFQASERHPDMLSALEMAVAHKISAYDAQFVALAHTLNAPLISEDKRLQNRCPGTVFGMDAYLKEQ